MKEREPIDPLVKAEEIRLDLRFEGHRMASNRDLWTEVLENIPSRLQEMTNQFSLLNEEYQFVTEDQKEQITFSTTTKEGPTIFWQKVEEKFNELVLTEIMLARGQSSGIKLNVRNHFYLPDVRNQTIAGVTFSDAWKRSKEILITPQNSVMVINSVRGRTPKITSSLKKEEALRGIYFPYVNRWQFPGRID